MPVQVFKNPVGQWAATQGRQAKKVERYLPKKRDPNLRGPFFRPEYAASTFFYEDLRILATVEKKDDGREWYHVSVGVVLNEENPEQRLPTYEEMALVRDLMFKANATVFQVFPPRSEHVSDHDYVLHLWTRTGKGRPIPDLRGPDPDGNLSI